MTGLDLDLMIIGAPKSGTSSLLAALQRAPGVVPTLRRELGYFTDDEQYRRGPSDALEKYFGARSPGRIRVGKLAGLMYNDRALERLLADSPRARLVAVLRNPVDRAYSAYWYARRVGFEPARSFEEALEREARGDDLHLPRLRSYLAKGEYVRQLERVRSAAGSESLTVILLDDLRRDPAGTTNLLLAPFGLATDSSLSLSPSEANQAASARSEAVARALRSATVRKVARRVVPMGLRGTLFDRLRAMNEREFDPPPLSIETRRSLVAHFEPWNAKLRAFLGRDLSEWTETPTA